MKRRTLTLLLLGGAVVPLVAVLFVFGCCVLPFHRLVHRVLPMCHVAAEIAAFASDRDDQVPASAPAEPARRPSPNVQLVASSELRLPASLLSERGRVTLAGDDASVRNVITIGAMRVDDDIGLALLFATLRI